MMRAHVQRAAMRIGVTNCRSRLLMVVTLLGPLVPAAGAQATSGPPAAPRTIHAAAPEMTALLHRTVGLRRLLLDRSSHLGDDGVRRSRRRRLVFRRARRSAAQRL